MVNTRCPCLWNEKKGVERQSWWLLMALLEINNIFQQTCFVLFMVICARAMRQKFSRVPQRPKSGHLSPQTDDQIKFSWHLVVCDKTDSNVLSKSLTTNELTEFEKERDYPASVAHAHGWPNVVVCIMHVHLCVLMDRNFVVSRSWLSLK